MIFWAFYTTLRTRLRPIWTTLEKHIFCTSVLNSVSRHLEESSPGWNIFDELSQQHLDIWQQMKSSSKPPLHLHKWSKPRVNNKIVQDKVNKQPTYLLLYIMWISAKCDQPKITQIMSTPTCKGIFTCTWIFKKVKKKHRSINKLRLIDKVSQENGDYGTFWATLWNTKKAMNVYQTAIYYTVQGCLLPGTYHLRDVSSILWSIQGTSRPADEKSSETHRSGTLWCCTKWIT
jgi:hypothetical protein